MKKLKNLITKIKNVKRISHSTPKRVSFTTGLLSGVSMLIPNDCEEMAIGKYDDFIFTTLTNNCIKLEATTIWDVGAHIGYHTLIYCKLVGQSGKVCAFEPNPYNIERLRTNINENSSITQIVTVYEYALSDKDEYREFIYSSNVDNTESSGSYLNYGHAPSDRYPSRVYKDFVRSEIPVYKPDTIISKFSVPPPSLIKIDIEGAEVNFLNGSSTLIENHKPAFIIEVHNIQNMFYICEFFKNKDYKIELLNDNQHQSSRCFVLAYHRC